MRVRIKRSFIVAVPPCYAMLLMTGEKIILNRLSGYFAGE